MRAITCVTGLGLWLAMLSSLVILGESWSVGRSTRLQLCGSLHISALPGTWQHLTSSASPVHVQHADPILAAYGSVYILGCMGQRTGYVI